MAFDGITIANIVKELNNTIVGGKINKIAQPEADELLLTIKNNRTQYRLLISASASLPLIYFTEKNKPSPLTAPNFCMLLRKHIGSGKITSVTQPGLERVIELKIEHLNELGDLCHKTLVVEIMGKHSNIIFLNEERMILDSIKIKWSPNINIICGENSTGKTTLIKLMYSCLKSVNNKKLSMMTQEQIETAVVEKMVGIFRPDDKKIGRLVSRKQGSNRTDIKLGLEKKESISIGFGNRQERQADIKLGVGDLKKFAPIFIPPKEMISATEHFQSLYEHYDIDFEEMYYDLTKLLDRPLKRGANTAEQNKVLASFEKIMDGSIVQKDKKFYLRMKKQQPGEIDQ